MVACRQAIERPDACRGGHRFPEILREYSPPKKGLVLFPTPFFFAMSAYLYILFSEKIDRFYVGSTDDLESRLKRHNAGNTPSTKAGAPLWELKYSEEYPTRSEACKREYAIALLFKPEEGNEKPLIL